jgi:hypothetical protein
MIADFVYQADMGFTRRELLKGLQTAVHPYEVKSLFTDPVEIVQDSRMVKLMTGADGFRAIASMRVPQLSVTLKFYGFSQQQHDQFMERFRKYLHKGGG